jgi:putative MATE family efflux protein
MNKNHELMGQEKISKLLVKFSLPAVVGMVVNALYNVVDRIYIGNIKEVGNLAIAGVGVTFPVMLISFAFPLLIGLGGATNISLNLGRKKRDLAEAYLGNAVSMGFVSGAILTFLTIFFMKSYVYKLGASEATAVYAMQYLEIVALGFPIAAVGYITNAAVRSDGNPKIAMITLLLGAGTNIILDPIFIFWMDMGVRGAALATIISQFVSSIWTVTYFRSKKSGLKLLFSKMIIKFHMAKEICMIGAGPFILQIGSSTVNLIINTTLLKYGGDTAVGAMTIVNGIATFVYMPIFGINQGLQPILGYNYGARLYIRVHEAYTKGVMAAVAISTAGFIVIQTLSKYFIYIFTHDQNLVAVAAHGLRIYTILLPFVGFQIVSSTYFQATGKPKTTAFLSLCRQVLFLIPAVFICSRLWGVAGIWMAIPISDLCSIIVTGTLVWHELKLLKKMEEEELQIRNQKDPTK